jgi:hypothetical protein
MLVYRLPLCQRGVVDDDGFDFPWRQPWSSRVCPLLEKRTFAFAAASKKIPKNYGLAFSL